MDQSAASAQSKPKVTLADHEAVLLKLLYEDRAVQAVTEQVEEWSNADQLTQLANLGTEKAGSPAPSSLENKRTNRSLYYPLLLPLLRIEKGGQLVMALRGELTRSLDYQAAHHRIHTDHMREGLMKAHGKGLGMKARHHWAALEVKLLASSLARLEVLPPDDDSREALVELVAAHVPTMSSTDLIQVLWSLGSLARRFRVMLELTSDLVSVVVAQLNTKAEINALQPKRLAQLGWSLATLTHYNPPLMQLLAKAAVRGLPAMTHQDVAYTFYAFAKLNHPVPQHLPALLAHVRNQVQQLSQRMDALSLAWSITILAPQEVELLKALISRAATFPFHNLAFIESAQIGAVFQHLAIATAPPPAPGKSEDWSAIPAPTPGHDAPAHPAFPLGSREERLWSWSWQFMRRRDKGIATPSHTQLAVVATLKALGTDPVMDGCTPCETLFLDCAVAWRGREVLVEVDGPRGHYAANRPQHPLGNTVLRNRLLKGMTQLPVVVVPYWEWDRCVDDESRRAYLTNLLDAALAGLSE